jgi:DNA-binding ferritin-like protein
MALRNIAAAALGLALLVAPAMAQQTPQAATVVKTPDDLSDAQMDELYCVYDEMAKTPDPVAESIITGNKEAVAKARAIHEAARTACVTRYKWSAEQADVAGTVATSAILADMTEKELRGMGVGDKTFEAVMKTTDKLSAADFEALLSMGQKKADEAMLDRLRKSLTDAGVPKDKDTVEVAIAFLQGSMAEYDAVLTWVDAKFY